MGYILQQSFSTSGGLTPSFFICYDMLLFIIPFNVVFLLLRAPASLSSTNILEINWILKNHLNQLGLWSCVSTHLLLDPLCPKANVSQQVRQFPVMPPHTNSSTTEQLRPFHLPTRPSQGQNSGFLLRFLELTEPEESCGLEFHHWVLGCSLCALWEAKLPATYLCA